MASALLTRLEQLMYQIASDGPDRVDAVAVLRQILALDLRHAVETPLLLWRPEHARALLWAPEVRELATVFDLGHHVIGAALGRALDVLALFHGSGPSAAALPH